MTTTAASEASGADPDSVGTMLGRTTELTGFDPTRVDGTGTTVVVAGTPGVGVRVLIDACRSIAPDLDLVERTPTAAAGLAVLVVDPSSSVADEELQLLDDLRAAYGVVGLVCTKIDAFWEWPRVLRSHRRTLDPYESLPLFAVSGVAAMSGGLDESGVVALVEWLREQMSAPVEIRRHRARLAAAQGAVEHLLDELDATEPDRLDELMRRRHRLVESRDRGRTDRLTAVRAGLHRVRAESSSQVQAGLRSIGSDLAGLDIGPAERRRALSARLDDLAAAVSSATDERIEEVSAGALIGLDTDTEPADEESWRVEVGPIRDTTDARRGAEDALVVLIGASTGLGVGRLVVTPMASVQTLQWISMPLTLVLGVAVAVWVIRMRRGATARAAARGWVSEVLAEVRSRVDHQIGQRVAGAETRIAGQIARSYDRRTRLVAAEVAALDERARGLRDSEVEVRRRREVARAMRQVLVDAQSALAESVRGRKAGMVKEGVSDGSDLR